MAQCVCVCAAHSIESNGILYAYYTIQSIFRFTLKISHETKQRIQCVRLLYGVFLTYATARILFSHIFFLWKMMIIIIVWQKHRNFCVCVCECHKCATDLRQIFAPILFALDF